MPFTSHDAQRVSVVLAPEQQRPPDAAGRHRKDKQPALDVHAEPTATALPVGTHAPPLNE